MGNMDYIRRQNISQRNRQFLTSYDWRIYLDFSNYKFYHPDMQTIELGLGDITGVDPTLENTPLTHEIRGFLIQQPGMTNNHAKNSITINLADFEDQTMKYWFLDWQNKMDSLTTHAAYRREDLMVDLYVWRLNSNQQKVWEMHYINCLPSATTYNDSYESNSKNLVGQNSSITLQAEMVIPTPLTQPLA